MVRVAVLSALVYDLGSYDPATGVIDPVIVVRGELPARAQPFGVDRLYRGPQGVYDESWAILDPAGALVYQHPYGRITLRGQMYEDRFRDEIRRGVTLHSAEDHTLVLLLNDQEVGRVPAFIEAPESATAAGVVGDALEATLKKSAIIWVTIPQPDGGAVTKPAWFVYQGGKVFVLTGPDEQDLTNIQGADEVTLTARSKDVRARIGAVPASVRIIDNDSDEFDRIATLGVGTRLNLPDGEAALERWKDTCTLVELTPQA
ncbi:MAG: hypothetical protein M3N57_13435 [Actinomycetota bacterium]|nr:hypothetical protein [Actinomycetota bacterium]